MAFYGFFDPTNQDHLDLLDPNVRDHDELERVVMRVERDILNAFRYRETGRIALDPTTNLNSVIALDGYDETSPLAGSDDGLVEELRYAVATVVSHRLLNKYTKRGRDPSLQSESLGDYSYSRAGGGKFEADWPDGWDADLRRLYGVAVDPLYYI